MPPNYFALNPCIPMFSVVKLSAVLLVKNMREQAGLIPEDRGPEPEVRDFVF